MDSLTMLYQLRTQLNLAIAGAEREREIDPAEVERAVLDRLNATLGGRIAEAGRLKRPTPTY